MPASRYTGNSILITENKRSFATFKMQPPSFYQQFDPTIIRVSEEDTVDQLAFDYYSGQGDLWWIILAANGLDLPTDIEPGMKLVIPQDYRSLLQALNNINKQ